MTVMLAGGSGFLGTKLAARLEREGHRVLILTRRPRPGHYGDVAWQPDGSPGLLPAQLAGVDAVVNLAGEGIAARRWTKSRKAALRNSRVLATRTLVRAMLACERPPGQFISQSGVDYYGDHGSKPVTEATPPGTHFLARLCVDWEQEARAAAMPGTRVAILRTAPVLGADGGVLAKMLLPFKLGLGATLGSGEQYLSWIHVDDWLSMTVWLLTSDRATGAFNAAAPTPVTNREFTRTLARVLKRPAVFRAPAFVLNVGLGEMAAMLLTGRRVLPSHAEELGFRFAFRELEPALWSLGV